MRSRLGSIWCGAALCVIAGIAAPARATTWSVPGDGSNTCTIGTPSCDTIQQAILTPVDGPVTVQLRNSDSGICWGATYTTGQLIKNQPGLLEAKAQ